MAPTSLLASRSSAVCPPFLWWPFPSLCAPPPRAPCMRHTAQPLTAGDRHGFPVLFERALQRKAWCMANFEEEGSVVAVIRDLYGSLAAAHHGVRNDGLVGVHGDVLHGDLLLAFADTMTATITSG